METFAEVERRLRRVTVTAPQFGDAHGVLTLDGEDSAIELTGDLPIGGPPPPGLFDLQLVDDRGRSLFVHNALGQGMTFSSRSEVRSGRYFPNMLVDDARAVDDDGRVRSISFGLDGWHNCFAYDHVETLDVFGPPTPELRSALEAARYEFKRDDPFEPQQVYLVHNLGTLVEFEANDLRYSMFAEHRGSFGGGDAIDVRFALIGTITFPEPVDLGAATDACWDWRRFFNQMAMGTMLFTGMAVAATDDPLAPRGHLYLPNERSERKTERRHGADAYHMPLNRWPEREALQAAMQAWMRRQRQRRVFRAALDRVLARPGHVAIEDAVALCAGIDTLAELTAKAPLPPGVLDAMAAAAVAAADGMACAVDPKRVRGLLGSLQADDLRRKLVRLAALAAPEAPEEDAARLIELVIGLRLFGAHGKLPSQHNNLIHGPAVEGLAALGAGYDLQQAGVPDQVSNGVRSVPRMRWDEALIAIRMTNATSA